MDKASIVVKWFRNNVKHGSRLALFALAIQFALSFGHFHAFAAPTAPATSTALVQIGPGDGNGLTLHDAAIDAAQTKQQQPATPDTDQPLDACAICAVASQASNVLFATPPLLLLPRAVELRYLITDTGFANLRPVDPAFRSRAPPAS